MRVSVCNLQVSTMGQRVSRLNPLQKAVEDGDVSRVNIALQNNPDDINVAENQVGVVPACLLHQKPSAYLITPVVLSQLGWTPLHIAAWKGNEFDAVGRCDLFLQPSRQVLDASSSRQQSHLCPLPSPCMRLRPSADLVRRQLILRGADPNARDKVRCGEDSQSPVYVSHEHGISIGEPERSASCMPQHS